MCTFGPKNLLDCARSFEFGLAYQAVEADRLRHDLWKQEVILLTILLLLLGESWHMAVWLGLENPTGNVA